MEPGIKINVNINGTDNHLAADKGSLLMDALHAAGISLSTECAGRGVCGSCRVQFLAGAPRITGYDEAIFTNKELDEGWRLACKSRLSGGAEILIPEQKNMTVLQDYSKKDTGQEILLRQPGFAVDIGTTTIVVYLVDRHSGEAIDSIGALNAQRQFGGDVSSRILYATEHGTGSLQRAVTGQLNEMIAGLCVKHALDISKSYDVLAVGNTAMAHFLLGYDASGLGFAPYTPYSLDRVTAGCRELGLDIDGSLTMMEGISGYVGSDIVAGAALCGLDESDGYRMLVDIGTNGEMMLGNRDKLLCCSTAAGPAFEGVNIHHGIGAVPGAISKISMNKQNSGFHMDYETIEDEPPIGICGSGVVDAVAGLFKNGIIDVTGRFAEDIEPGFITEDDELGGTIVLAHHKDKKILFSQKDVREVQLAKGAIAAGIRILLDEAGIGFDEIERVYLAGGFGNYMDIESALTIGLLPKELAGRIEPSGNTAGKGAVKALASADFRALFENYAQNANHIELYGHDSFQEYFIGEMGF